MAKPQPPDLGNLLKPVSALAIVPKSSQITRVGRQAYNAMLVLAQGQGEGAEFFEAPLSRILTGFSAAKDTAREVKRHLRSMMTTLVEWQSPSPAETTPWKACVLLAEAHLDMVNGETWVRWAYPPTIRSELLNPQRYAQIKMQTVAQLRTHAAVALYEICARYRDNPSGVTSRQHWTWWLPVLTGAPAESRKTEYRFFKRDYIRPAIDDINEISDLHIEVIEHKLGRSIDQIQFRVTKKPSTSSVAAGTPASEPMDVGQIVRAQALGIASGFAEDMHFRFGIAALRGALDALEKRMALKGQAPIADPAAYVRAVLNGTRAKKAAIGPPAQQPEAAVTVVDRSPAAPAIPVHQANLPGDAQVAWEQQRFGQLKAEVESLDDEPRSLYLQGLRAELLARGGFQSLTRRIDAGNWKSPLVLTELVAFYGRSVYGQDWKLPAAADSPSH
ncbi:MAG: hypothetical protein K0Q43_140 [Ramlibacter sp.]|jgi:hypothetical protein|nr:hypothetical protein [Ramlibacter sp.]